MLVQEASAQAANLPQTGTYSGHFGWTFSGQVQELGPNRKVYAGLVSGVMFNDAGNGFEARASAVLT